jgi:uncharacterized protein YqeY
MACPQHFLVVEFNDVYSRNTAMSLRERINEDMKTEVDERVTLSDSDILAVIDKMVKQRKDSIEQYKAGNRPDLVAKEEFELGVLAAYMPAQLSEAEVMTILDGVIAQTGAQGAKDMGKVMNALRPLVAGRADMGKLSGLVKSRLG